MTKEEFLKLGEETQREIITDLTELWAKNTDHKEKRSAFICLANNENEEKTKLSNCIFGTGELVLASILQHLSKHPELGILLARCLILNPLGKMDE